MAGIRNGRSRSARAFLSVALVAMLAAFTLAAPPEPAHAAVVDVSDSATLIGALSVPTTTVVRLTDSFVVADTTLQVPRSVALELNGQVLTTKNITLSPGVEFIVQDTSATASGKLAANSASTVAPLRDLAGITTTNAAMVIESGRVEARGGQIGAGIGGDDGRNGVGHGGSVTINGGSVLAHGYLVSTGYTAGTELLLAALLMIALGTCLKIAAVGRRHELR